MPYPLKYNTASQEVPLGYFLDSTDGDTEKTALTIANTDIKLHKAGATTLANKNSGGATHISNGIYYATLDATDTNTYGPLTIFVHVAGALACKLECVVMNAVAYDSLYGTDNFDVNVTQWLGTATTLSSTTSKPEIDVYSISDDATAANNAELDYDGTGYNKSNSTIGTCTANTDMRGTDNALLAASAPTNFGDLAITVTTGQVTVGTNNDKTGYTVSTVTDKTGYSISGIKTTLDALNDVSTTDVLIQAASALTTYDAPTYTEMLNFFRLVLRSDSALATDLAAEITAINANLGSGAGAFANTTDSQQSIRDRGDAAWITGNTIAPDNTTISTINTKLGTPAASVSTDIASVKSDTGTILTESQSHPTLAEIEASSVIAKEATIAALNNISVTDILTGVMTESYAADGAAVTLSQALYMIMQILAERSVSGTTLTIKRLDGTTTAMTFTLDSGTAPTTQTRAT